MTTSCLRDETPRGASRPSRPVVTAWPQAWSVSESTTSRRRIGRRRGGCGPLARDARAPPPTEGGMIWKRLACSACGPRCRAQARLSMERLPPCRSTIFGHLGEAADRPARSARLQRAVSEEARVLLGHADARVTHLDDHLSPTLRSPRGSRGFRRRGMACHGVRMRRTRASRSSKGDALGRAAAPSMSWATVMTTPRPGRRPAAWAVRSSASWMTAGSPTGPKATSGWRERNPGARRTVARTRGRRHAPREAAGGRRILWASRRRSSV